MAEKEYVTSWQVQLHKQVIKDSIQCRVKNLIINSFTKQKFSKDGIYGSLNNTIHNFNLYFAISILQSNNYI
jgi:hypothetical protein